MRRDKKGDLEASMSNRRPVAHVENEMAGSVFGQMVDESRNTTLVDVTKIKPSPFQSRGEMDELHLEDLMMSILDTHLVSPVIVRHLPDGYFELIAGHHRTEAFRRLNRDRIPAIVRTMTDSEAARALTVDNTMHQNLTDWELHKHIKMLREQGFTKGNTDLANIMGCARTSIYRFEAFGLLPDSVKALLDIRPDLIGGNLAAQLDPYCKDHGELITQAIDLLATGKIKQVGVLGWIKRKIEQPVIVYRKEIDMAHGTRKLKMIIHENDVKITGAVDFEKLRKLIEKNLDSIILEE